VRFKYINNHFKEKKSNFIYKYKKSKSIIKLKCEKSKSIMKPRCEKSKSMFRNELKEGGQRYPIISIAKDMGEVSKVF
jgi:hypothetical protein